MAATSRLGNTGKAKVSAVSSAIAGLSDAEITEKMLTKLAGSALDKADAKAMKLEACNKTSARRRALNPAAECFVIPYFDLKGRVTKFYRARYVVDTRRGFDKMAGRKALRYIQPANTVTEAYLPPLGVSWASIASNPEVPIIVTEGELKAACATKHGHPTIGLGGVWSFMSKKRNVPLLPIFDEFVLKDRVVYICFDSDAATNPDVTGAERKLSEQLCDRGALVHIVRLAPGEDGSKMGLDDFIVNYGTEAFTASLEAAVAYAGSEMLHELNERVVYVRNPGVLWDHTLKMRLAPQGFTSHAYSDWAFTEVIETKNGSQIRKVQAAVEWLKWPFRAAVNALEYAPGEDRITQNNALNVWSGWGLPNGPMEGDISPWHALMDHLFGINRESREYFERWCAYPLQHPGVKMAVACALWGPTHGTGKTLVGHTLMRIYGDNGAEIKDSDLEDDRNEWAENKQFVLADDITSRGDRKFMRRLMTMITQKQLRLNPKYIPSYSVSDRINYYFTSNDPDALFMDDQDRRFFVHEVRAGRFEDFRRYVAWRESDSGAAALWHYLLNLPLGDFDPQAPAPMTAGKQSMIELGKSDLGAWVLDLRQNPDSILKRFNMTGDLFSAQELHAIYDQAGDKKASVNALARELKRAGLPVAGGDDTKLKRPDGSTVRAYAIRNINDWQNATWKDACQHYVQHRPELSRRPGGKF